MTFNRSWYATGTVSVNNAATSVTGVGTSWLSFGIREGDYFFSGGLMVPISAVGSNTGITLASGWPGSNISGANYFIVPASESVRTVVASRTVLDLLLNGTTAAFAGLTGAANKIAYFTAADAMAVADFTEVGRAVVGAANVAAQRTALELGSLATMSASNVEFSDETPTWSGAGLQYHQHSSQHIAYIKKAGAYAYYWRKSADGAAAEATDLMVLDDDGDLSVVGALGVAGLTTTGVLSHAVGYGGGVGNWVVDNTSNLTISVADGAYLLMPLAFSGVIVLNSYQSGSVAVFLAGAGAIVMLGQTGATFAASAESGKIYAAFDAGNSRYYFVNDIGSTHSINVYAIRTRSDA